MTTIDDLGNGSVAQQNTRPFTKRQPCSSQCQSGRAATLNLMNAILLGQAATVFPIARALTPAKIIRRLLF